jgi:hypothetical protein
MDRALPVTDQASRKISYPEYRLSPMMVLPLSRVGQSTSAHRGVPRFLKASRLSETIPRQGQVVLCRVMPPKLSTA